MNAEILIKYFDRISGAPEAISHFRQFILNLAVRGKLVEQNRNDEPASELLGRIAAEKAKLVASGESKHQAIQSVTPDELEFPAPKGWSWARLAAISRRIHYGYTASADQSLTDVKLLRITDIQNNCVDWRTVPGCQISADEVGQYRLEKSDILIARTGGTIGKTFLVTETPPQAVFASYLIRVQPLPAIFDRYLKLFLESPIYWKQLHEGSRGTGQPNVNGQTLGRLIIALPPLAEQHRIVAKVEELMEFCDRIEEIEKERETRRDRLTAACLHHLNSGVQGEALRTHVRFFINHISGLTARGDQIHQLRQSLLDLAISGYVVAQDPREEPASALLGKIQDEKQRLILEGKITPPSLSKSPRHEDIPRPGWQITTLRDVLLELQTGPFGSSLHQSDYQKGGVPVINPASIRDEHLVPVDGMAVGPTTLERLSNFKLQVGDIVMARRGEMGRCALVTENEKGWLCGTGSLILRLPSFVVPAFFVKLLGSPQVRKYLGGSAVGATMQNLNQSILLGLAFGLPPATEQLRIVVRIEELMALCDQLEERLRDAKTVEQKLLDSVLYEALAAPTPGEPSSNADLRPLPRQNEISAFQQ